MESIHREWLVLVFFIFLSAFFSSSETALFSLKKSDLFRYSSSENKKEKLISQFMIEPQKILITILLGNLFVNLVISSISTRIMLGIWGNYGHFIAIALVTPIIIILCEISPKTVAIHDPRKFSGSIITPLRVFHWLLYPLRKSLEAVTWMVMRMFKLHMREQSSITEEELDMAIRLGEHDGIIAKEEGSFIKNVLRFSRKEAENIMIPRNQAVFIPYGSSIDDAAKIFMDTGQVRAPVYKSDFDHIVGVLDLKEMIPYIWNYRRSKNINKLLKSIYHFPASKELGDLLTEFLDKKIQIAVVMDEYGGTAGLVTLSGILKELLGKEFTLGDEAHKPDVKKINDTTYIINGDMQIDDFNIFFRENLTSTESETIGGYVTEMLGHFPKKNEEFSLDVVGMKVKRIRNNRIELLEVRMKGFV